MADDKAAAQAATDTAEPDAPQVRVIALNHGNPVLLFLQLAHAIGSLPLAEMRQCTVEPSFRQGLGPDGTSAQGRADALIEALDAATTMADAVVRHQALWEAAQARKNGSLQ